MGSVPALACSVAAANLQVVLGLPAGVQEAWPEPVAARIAHRGQYDAGKILASLAIGLSPDRLRLGITTWDLCLPMLSHVFGEAGVGGRVAVVSLFRLGDLSAKDEATLARRYERLAKVAVHEAGHALGLLHCRCPGCVMGGVPSVESLDGLTLRLCRGCEHALRGLRDESGPSGRAP